LEDEEAYKAFERAIIQDYAPETAIERSLVVRLASLLWRLRRALAIESGLFEIHGAREQRNSYDPSDPLKVFRGMLRNHQANQIIGDIPLNASFGKQDSTRADLYEFAVCFLRLEKFNNGMLDLIGRYETRLWRQVAQTMLILESTRQVPVRIGRHQLGSIRSSQLAKWRLNTRT
jgi:hypothetical protein